MYERYSLDRFCTCEMCSPDGSKQKNKHTWAYFYYLKRCGDSPSASVSGDKVIFVTKVPASRRNRVSLTLKELQRVNWERAEQWHGHTEPWSLQEWTNAMAGEAGESCNVTKKIKRNQQGIEWKNPERTDVLLLKLGEELADTVLYATLTAQAAGIDLEWAIKDKFNRVSEEAGFPQRL